MVVMRKDDLTKKTSVRPRVTKGKTASVSTKKITMKKKPASEKAQSSKRQQRMMLGIEILVAVMLVAAIVWLVVVLLEKRNAAKPVGFTDQEVSSLLEDFEQFNTDDVANTESRASFAETLQLTN